MVFEKCCHLSVWMDVRMNYEQIFVKFDSLFLNYFYQNFFEKKPSKIEENTIKIKYCDTDYTIYSLNY